MPITFEAGGEIVGTNLPDVVLNGGSLFIDNSVVGDLTVNAGVLTMTGSQCADLVVNSDNGSSAFLSGCSVSSLTATGGALSQDLVVSGTGYLGVEFS